MGWLSCMNGGLRMIVLVSALLVWPGIEAAESADSKKEC